MKKLEKMKNSLSIVAFLLIGSASFAQTPVKECKDKNGNPCCHKTGPHTGTEVKKTSARVTNLKYQALPKAKFVPLPAKEK
jgi:hypothetical protein